MSDERDESHRVKYFGPRDLANGWQLDRVEQLLNQEPYNIVKTINDALEVLNVCRFIEGGILPQTYGDGESEAASAWKNQGKAAVARFFNLLVDVEPPAAGWKIYFEYRTELLGELERARAFEKIPAEKLLPSLEATGLSLRDFLSSKPLVNNYQTRIRDQILSDPQHAEMLIDKLLGEKRKRELHVPTNITSSEKRELLESYIRHERAHPNYVALIARASTSTELGIDPKLKLLAKRRQKQLTDDLFANGRAITSGAEVSLSRNQVSPVEMEMQGAVACYSYGESWLNSSLDRPSVLNNFQYLFEFADEHSILQAPSYANDLGVIERVIGVTGKRDYPTGIAFGAKEASATLQCQIYEKYLEAEGIELESVIEWFFTEYLAEEFDATGFTFEPSPSTASHLTRVRHLFAEMEGVINQFRLFVDDGEIDFELLSVSAEAASFAQVPSLVERKYLYAVEGEPVQVCAHLLFSDQSRINYISEDRQASSFAQLLLHERLVASDFRDDQRSAISFLVDHRIIKEQNGRLQFASLGTLKLLRQLFTHEAASYYWLTENSRAIADEWLQAGWLNQQQTLLTTAESRYFNYVLNRTQFDNGPELRNKYVHGAQARNQDPSEHYATYSTALRLIVMIAIKINDDFRQFYG
ncbi:hypothetical protein [Frigoribacterium faeni]|uniref:hypothetical protein n=1 Tax=Frigoribacterium faeni TaxID=145483 RepID=UPI00241398A9|nr:hypothetical protein [Frigoribacterium faeni]